MSLKFYFSVIRIVPDPIRFEPVNVGVVVLSEDGLSGDLEYNPRIRTRLAAIDRALKPASIFTAIEDLREYLGIDHQVALGVEQRRKAGLGREKLARAGTYLENQLQITEPKLYQGASLSAVLDETFRRYVIQRVKRQQARRELTAVEMRTQIWKVIRDWKDHNISVERRGWLKGPETKARHPADFIFKNGHPTAALFALAMAAADQAATSLYRDSLPTIATDIGPDFVAYAVLPDVEEETSRAVREFIDETRALLARYEPFVRAVSLSEVQDIQGDIIKHML